MCVTPRCRYKVWTIHHKARKDGLGLKATLFSLVEVVSLEVHVDVECCGRRQRREPTSHLFTFKDAARWRTQLAQRLRKIKALLLEIGLTHQVFAPILHWDRSFCRISRYRELTHGTDPCGAQRSAFVFSQPGDENEIALVAPHRIAVALPRTSIAVFHRFRFLRKLITVCIPCGLNALHMPARVRTERCRRETPQAL